MTSSSLKSRHVRIGKNYGVFKLALMILFTPVSSYANQLEASGCFSLAKLTRTVKTPAQVERKLTGRMRFNDEQVQDWAFFSSQEGYKPINKVLRKGGPGPALSPKHKREASIVASRLIDSIRSQAPLDEPIILYRGMFMEHIGKVGETVNLSGMSSCSFSQDIAMRFIKKTLRSGKRVIAKIQVGPGARVAILGKISEKLDHPEEREVVLAHGAKVKVIATEEKPLPNGETYLLQTWQLVDDGT